MTASKIVLKEVGPIRVAELTAVAVSYEPAAVGAAIGSLYPELRHRLASAGLRGGRVAIVYYEDPAEATEAVIVHAAIPLAAAFPGVVDTGGTAAPRRGHGFAVVDLPAVRCATVITDCGLLDDVRQSLWMLAGWITEHGYLPAADSHREVYLGCCPGEPGRGAVEVQAIVTGAPAPDMRRPRWFLMGSGTSGAGQLLSRAAVSPAAGPMSRGRPQHRCQPPRAARRAPRPAWARP